MKRAVRGLIVLLFSLLVVFPSYAQERSVFWKQWDVVIDNVDTTANHFDVREIYDVQFSGTFRFGSRVIPVRGLDEITNVAVYQQGEPLRASCNESPGTYCFDYNRSDGYTITYYFLHSVTDATIHIEIAYRVLGALRIYEGGDQLWWDAIPDEHFGFAIGSSTVTVELPSDYAPREGVDPIETYGAAGDISVNGSRVVARAVNGVGGNESFSLRIQYPHDPNAITPDWQGSFDTQRAYDENVRPLVDIGVCLASLIILIGGTLLVVLRYQARGRDPQVGIVPEYLSEPPSDLPPAVVGTLIDERAEMQDVLSTLLDLAHRGYLVIEEEQDSGFLGIGSVSHFTFKRTDKSTDDLRDYEQLLLSRIFGSNRMERTLESLRNKFYTAIPTIQKGLYDETVKEGLFPRSPQAVRSSWQAGGVILIVLAVLAFFFAVGAVDDMTPTLIALPVSLGIVGVIVLIFSNVMPAKTAKGAEEAAKWRAFREYLRNLEKYDSVDGVATRFDQYLPYAVAFGLNRIWINRFREVQNMTMPPWYVPTYLGGPYRGGYTAGTPLSQTPFGSFGGERGLPGELARAGQGDFSFDEVSSQMARGLDSLSSGLTTMLDSASRTMTSRPQQSGGSGRWSGGGSSWSGGGFSGGGGSGGGSSGFG